MGTNAMDSPLLKYSAKEYFFKAALCHFCIDMLNAKVGLVLQSCRCATEWGARLGAEGPAPENGKTPLSPAPHWSV